MNPTRTRSFAPYTRLALSAVTIPAAAVALVKHLRVNCVT
jgi:hypothetical protein